MPLRRLAVIGAALIGEDGVRDVTIVRATMLRPSISRPFDIRLRPWGLPPSYRFATKALLLRYIAGGDVRYDHTLEYPPKRAQADFLTA